MNTEQAKREKRKYRLPLLLSAIVCPGAGQFVQKRWAAGVFFSAGFLVGFIWLMIAAGKIIISYYRMAFELEYEPEAPDLWAILPPIAIAFIFYVINLMDVMRAQFRLIRKELSRDTDSSANL